RASAYRFAATARSAAARFDRYHHAATAQASNPAADNASAAANAHRRGRRPRPRTARVSARGPGTVTVSAPAPAAFPDSNGGSGMVDPRLARRAALAPDLPPHGADRPPPDARFTGGPRWALDPPRGPRYLTDSCREDQPIRDALT